MGRTSHGARTGERRSYPAQVHPAERALRVEELARAQRWLVGRDRVLDIGAGNGTQAALLTASGHRVAAVDVPGRDRRSPEATVIEYDGLNLPFPASTFDAVFSSMVLQMLDDPAPLLAETHRVAREDAVYVHVVPTPTWRAATSVAYYVTVGGRALRRRKTDGTTGRTPAPERSAAKHPRRYLTPPPQGAALGALAELRSFRRASWIDVLRRSGLTVYAVESNRLFYTGYGLWPSLPFCVRRAIARLVGGSAFTVIAAAAGDAANAASASA